LLSTYLVILEAEGWRKPWPLTGQQLIIHKFVAGGEGTAGGGVGDATQCL